MKKNARISAMQPCSRLVFEMVIIAVLSIFSFKGLFAPGQAEAAQIGVINQFNATPCATATTSGSMTCANPTIGSGTNRVLILVVTGEAGGNHNPASTTATYGSASFVQMQNSYGNNDNRRYAWIGYINESQIAANTGSDINMTLTSSAAWVGTEAYYAVYQGVEQSGGTATVPGSTLSDSPNTTTTVNMGPISTAIDGLTIYAISANATSGNTTVPNGYTEHVDQADASSNYFSTIGSLSGVPGTTESVSMTAVNARWTAVFISLAPAASPPAGITVNPTGGLTTTEAGGAAQFTIVLDSAPTNDVTIGISSSDTSEGTVSPGSVTFTSGNWSAARTVTVTGVDDAIVDGNIAYTIATAAASSADSSYSGLDAADVSVMNTDDDVASSPGITVSPTTGLTTTEAGGQGQFTIVLNSAPTTNVTIGISSSTTGEGTVSPVSVTFTSGNWSTPQTVTITGVDDAVIDGNINYWIITAPATSGDNNYSGMDAADVSATNIDNDGAPPAIPAGNIFMITAVALGILYFGVMKNRQRTGSI